MGNLIEFRSRKDIWHKIIFYGFSMLFVISIVFIWLENEESLSVKILLTIFLLLVSGLLLCISFQTLYQLDQQYLHYQSGPLKGKISIESIREIHVNKTLFVGFVKPATSFNGLIIHYNRFDEIYITPESNEEFVAKILELNPAITIKRF